MEEEGEQIDTSSKKKAKSAKMASLPEVGKKRLPTASKKKK